MQKKERQDKLITLISSTLTASQRELASLLNIEGFEVTQASVSRDLVELGVVKIDGRYSLPPKAPASAEFGTVTFETAGENLIVGRCSSGLASAVTVKIDGARHPSIVGTIAGDDTIFIAVKDGDSQRTVLDTIGEMFG